MIRFFTSIGGFLLGALLFTFLIIIAFNPNFFAEKALKDFTKDLATPATNSLDKFLDESVLKPILDNPETLTRLGLHQLDFLTNHNEKLDDYSVEKAEENHEEFLKYYSKLNSFDEVKLPGPAKLNLQVAKFSAGIEKRGFEKFRYFMGPFIQFYGSHLHFVNFMTDTHRLDSKNDAADYIKRVNEIPRVIDELMVFEERRANAGIYSPNFVYEKSLNQLISLIETPTNNHPLYLSFIEGIEKIEISADEKAEMVIELEDAIKIFKTSYAKLKNLVEKNSLGAREFDGVWSLPNGEDYYKHRLQIYTTTDLTADEIHNLGLKLVKEIQSEIKAF